MFVETPTLDSTHCRDATRVPVADRDISKYPLRR